MACKHDTTNRVIQRKLLSFVINIRRLSLRACLYTEHNIPHARLFTAEMEYSEGTITGKTRPKQFSKL
jgi:hypothetical protein